MFRFRQYWTAVFIVVIEVFAVLTLGLAPAAPKSWRPMLARTVTPPPQSSNESRKTPKRLETKSATDDAKPAQPAPVTIPITVSGRAADSEGKPITGATIHLVSTNGIDAPIETTTTDRDGTYTFRNARLPVARNRDDAPFAGTFQVYGTAPGHGFTWHGMRFYQHGRRPDDWKVAGEDYSLFGSDPKVMNLRFSPAAALGGRIEDETGRPVPNVKVRIWHCDYLDTAGKESHHNFREFWAISAAPAALTTTKTDEDGRFRLEGLPKEAGFWIHVTHPEYAWLGVYAATTSRRTTEFDFPRQVTAGNERPPVETGEMKITLRATRRIAVRTVFADSGKPAPRVRVSAGRGSAGNNAGGTTDSEGRLVLRLPPGEYEILADPTEGGAACVRTISSFRVNEQQIDQSLEVRVKPGCVLILEVVDAKTGNGIPGIQFLGESNDNRGARSRVQSRTGYIDNPVSGTDGRLRAVVSPGEGVYSVGHIPESAGYRESSVTKRVTLTAGQTVNIQFQLERN
jgi:protocatechuate 3,4-dioxygenase beta subunit